MIEIFENIIGTQNIITDKSDMMPFITEWRGRFSQDCLGVIQPRSAQEVSECIVAASGNGLRIVPQGGNTGLVGGQIPKGAQPQIILSLRKMTQIRDISPHDHAVTAEAGVTLSTLQTQAKNHNLLFPMSLASEGSATIGGLISTNAGGTSVLKYGNMRDLILGLETVLPNGDILKDTHYLRKHNMGFDPKYLFIGAEGKHGIVTAASLKLFSRPKSSMTCFLGITSPQNAIDILHLLQQATGDNITEFELVPQIGLEFIEKHYQIPCPLTHSYPWYCLVTAASGFDETILRTHLFKSLEKILETSFAHDAVIAENIAQSDKLRQIRMLLSESQKPEGASIKHDVSVPVRHIPELISLGITKVKKILPNVRPCPFGHAGDGNIHFNFSQPIGMDKDEFMAYEPEINAAIFDIVHKLGGCFSAEHGIGSLRTAQMYQYRSPQEMTLRKKIKAALDPNEICNPNK